MFYAGCRQRSHACRAHPTRVIAPNSVHVVGGSHAAVTRGAMRLSCSSSCSGCGRHHDASQLSEAVATNRQRHDRIGVMSSGAAPKVFISYSHDSTVYKEWVVRLAMALNDAGIQVALDVWDLGPGQDIAAYMNRSVMDADKVLLLCTELYVDKVNNGRGGAGYEGMIVTAEILRNIQTAKFVPILKSNDAGKVPTALGTKMYVDLRGDEQSPEYDATLDALIRSIHGEPTIKRPPLGVFKARQGRVKGEVDTANVDAWYREQRQRTEQGIAERAAMEVRFHAVSPPPTKEQSSLLETLRRCEIKTFGWPLGMVLNSGEGSPKVRSDGIWAEIEGRVWTDFERYDYWALRNDGAFYCRGTLFEDERDNESIFFNTRIVRATEVLLLARNLYKEFGVPVDTPIRYQLSHEAIKGRRLSSSSSARHLSPFLRKIDENNVETSIDRLHPLPDGDIPSATKSLIEPLLVLFNFFKLSDSVYTEIVTEFINGRVT
jgi:hypothetical protein